MNRRRVQRVGPFKKVLASERTSGAVRDDGDFAATAFRKSPRSYLRSGTKREGNVRI